MLHPRESLRQLLSIDVTYIDIAQNLTTLWSKNVRYRQFSRA